MRISAERWKVCIWFSWYVGEVGEPSEPTDDFGLFVHAFQHGVEVFAEYGLFAVVSGALPLAGGVLEPGCGGVSLREGGLDVAAEHEFGELDGFTNAVGGLGGDVSIEDDVEECGSDVIDGLASKGERFGFFALPVADEGEREACQGGDEGNDWQRIGHGFRLATRW